MKYFLLYDFKFKLFDIFFLRSCSFQHAAAWWSYWRITFILNNCYFLFSIKVLLFLRSCSFQHAAVWWPYWKSRDGARCETQRPNDRHPRPPGIGQSSSSQMRLGDQLEWSTNRRNKKHSWLKNNAPSTTGDRSKQFFSKSVWGTAGVI